MEGIGNNVDDYEGGSDDTTEVRTDSPPPSEADQRQARFKLTMEVPIFLAMLGVTLADGPTTNLVMYRTCVHSLNYTKEVCQSFLTPEKLNHTQELETAVQKYATAVDTVKSLLEAVVPAILSVFIGVWSDKHGRKPLAIWPLLGMFASSALTAVYSVVQSLGPWWVVLTVIPTSLSGGFMVLMTGSLCYVSDITTTEQRTIRLLCIQLALAIAGALGSAISPYLWRYVSDVSYLLLVVTAVFAIGYAFTVIFVEESLKTATPGTILSVPNIDHVKEMIAVCFKKKPNYGRAITFLVITSSALSLFTVWGNMGLLYSYTRRKIHWTMKDFNTFMSVSTTMWFLGAVFAVGVLQPVFRLSDITFSMLSIMCCIAEYLIKGFATNTWQMYLGSAVSLFGTISGSLQRSFLTKILPVNDIGKVFALQSAAESICPLFAPLVYNLLYVCTINSFPGAFLVLSSGINVICFSLLAVIQYILRKTSNITYQTINE